MTNDELLKGFETDSVTTFLFCGKITINLLSYFCSLTLKIGMFGFVTNLIFNEVFDSLALNESLTSLSIISITHHVLLFYLFLLLIIIFFKNRDTNPRCHWPCQFDNPA